MGRRSDAFFAFIKKSIANSKLERIALISGYPDNHCLVTRYPDNRYETRLTQPKLPQGTPYGGAAQPSNEIQSTKYYVRIYQRIMQNKPNLLDAKMNANLYISTDYENKSNRTLGENKPNSNPIKAIKEAERKKSLRNFFRVSVAGNDFKGCFLSNIPIELIFNLYPGSLPKSLKLNKYEFLSRTPVNGYYQIYLSENNQI